MSKSKHASVPPYPVAAVPATVPVPSAVLSRAKITRSISLPLDLAQAVEYLAAKQGESVTATIVAALRAAVAVGAAGKSAK